MEDVGTKWGNKGDGIGFEVGDTGNKAEEVTFDKLFLGDPELFSAVVDDCVLMGMSVNSEGTGRGVKEVGKEVFYRYLWE